MAVNPKAWIYGLIDILPSPLERGARAIADRVFGILDDGVTFAKWIAGGVLKLAESALAHGVVFAQFVADVVLTLVWLETVYIPRKILAATSALRTFIAQEIARAKTLLTAAINALQRFVIGELGKLGRLLLSLRDWALAHLNAIRDRLKNTVDKWFERMTDPTKMAEWLVGALMGPLWRYVYSKRDIIARWFLDSSPAFVLWLVRTLEPTIRKLL